MAENEVKRIPLTASVLGRYAIQLSDGNLTQLIRHWLDWDKPVDLKMKKPHGRGITAVVVQIQDGHQADWLESVIKNYRYKLFKLQ